METGFAVFSAIALLICCSYAWQLVVWLLEIVAILIQRKSELNITVSWLAILHVERVNIFILTAYGAVSKNCIWQWIVWIIALHIYALNATVWSVIYYFSRGNFVLAQSATQGWVMCKTAPVGISYSTQFLYTQDSSLPLHWITLHFFIF